MTTPIISWSDEIEPGSKPTFMFPLLASSLHVALVTADPFGITSSLISNETGIIFVSIEGLPTGFDAVDTIAGQLIGDPVPIESPAGGQLGNLNVTFSKNGAGFIAGLGVLAEIGNGVYKYTLDSTETQQPGSGLIRITPVNPAAIANSWITNVYLVYRVTKPGIPITTPAPGSTTIINPQSLTDLKNFMMQQTSTILDAMQTKPTFRRDQ